MALGKAMIVRDSGFTLAIDEDPIIVAADVVSVKPRLLRAAVSRADMGLVQKAEARIMAEFAQTAFAQCGFASPDEMANFVDETFVTACRLHEVRDAVVTLPLSSPPASGMRAGQPYALSLRPDAISGNPEVLKIVWRVTRVSLPAGPPAQPASEGIAAALTAIDDQVARFRTSRDTIEVVEWLTRHGFDF
jgi:hypothetical protein